MVHNIATEENQAIQHRLYVPLAVAAPNTRVSSLAPPLPPSGGDMHSQLASHGLLPVRVEVVQGSDLSRRKARTEVRSGVAAAEKESNSLVCLRVVLSHREQHVWKACCQRGR